MTDPYFPAHSRSVLTDDVDERISELEKENERLRDEVERLKVEKEQLLEALRRREMRA